MPTTMTKEYKVQDPNRDSRTLTAEEIISQFEKSDISESIGKIPLERLFGTWLMTDFRATVDDYAGIVADLHKHFDEKKERPITSKQIQKLKPFINFSKLCRSADLNRSTISSKISQGQALKYDESARLAAELRNISQLINNHIQQ